ncbi:MAG TPA: LytTR family DNA-binding domain-containing protein [Thermoanaerobaculia bacterium]|jgi:two-component system LytT family response regulator
MSIRVVIVDDEPLARARVRMFISEHNDVEIVAEASDHEEALEAIAEHQPHALFIDVEMPGMSGVDVVRQLGAAQRPVVVFITAFAQYAVEAFDVGATHYLVKPFGPEDVRAALQRIRDVLSNRAATAIVSQIALGVETRQAPQTLQRVVVKRNGRAMLLRVHDIDWIEAAGNYARLHVRGAHHLLRESISSLEQKLDGREFVRVHRSAVVNLERVRELQPTSHGDYAVILDDGTRLILSRHYRSRLEMLLGRL